MKNRKLWVISTLALGALFASVAQATAQGGPTDLDALEAALSFDGMISAKAGPSAHTSTFTVRVGTLAYLDVDGKTTGFVLAFQERIPDGACFIDKVYEFETGALVLSDRYGNPGCGRIHAEPRRLTALDPDAKGELVSMLRVLHTMVGGGFFPTGKPEPALAPAVAYLDQVVSTLP